MNALKENLNKEQQNSLDDLKEERVKMERVVEQIEEKDKYIEKLNNDLNIEISQRETYE